jgi:hypothetical protein
MSVFTGCQRNHRCVSGNCRFPEAQLLISSLLQFLPISVDEYFFL